MADDFSYLRECEVYAAEPNSLKKNGSAIVESLDFVSASSLSALIMHPVRDCH